MWWFGKEVGWGHMSLVLVSHPGNTDGEVFMNFEIVNFYEINNFVSKRVSFYIVSLCKTSYLNVSFINCIFIHSFIHLIIA